MLGAGFLQRTDMANDPAGGGGRKVSLAEGVPDEAVVGKVEDIDVLTGQVLVAEFLEGGDKAGGSVEKCELRHGPIFPLRREGEYPSG